MKAINRHLTQRRHVSRRLMSLAQTQEESGGNRVKKTKTKAVKPYREHLGFKGGLQELWKNKMLYQIGRASCRERV